MKETLPVIAFARHTFSKTLALGFMLCSPVVTMAQKETPVLYDPADTVEMTPRAILQRNAPDEFVSGGNPRFLHHPRDSKFIVGVGGFVKTTVGVDFGHPIENADNFITSDIPMRDMEGDNSSFNVSGRQTHIYLNVVALPGTANEIGAFVSANLLDNYCPTLQFAYLRYRGFQAGYDYTLFSDPVAVPPAIDKEGPNAFTAVTTTGLRYGIDVGDRRQWRLAIGAEMPMASFTTAEGKTRILTQKVPDIPVAVRYAWGGGDSWVRLSGILRNLYYRDEITRRNVDKVGYGIQLSGQVQLLPQLTAQWQGVYGKGIASYIQDLTDKGMDLTPTADGRSLKAVEAWGAYGALTWNITDAVYCSAVYSQVRAYPRRYESEASPWGEQYSYAQYAGANLFWDINSYFTVGAEYLWGRRADCDGMKCSDNRVQAMVQFSF